MVSSKKIMRQMLTPMDMFPNELPSEMDEVLIKIEVLCEYGHVRSAFEEIAQWIHNTPEGTAYEYSNSGSDESYHKWTTWALFNRLVREKIVYDEPRLTQMKAFITCNLRDKNTLYTKTALLYIMLVLDNDPAWTGSELMTPGLSDARIDHLVTIEMEDRYTLQ